MSSESCFWPGALTNVWIAAQKALYERTFNYGALTVIETSSAVAKHVFAVAGVLLGLGPLALYARGSVASLVQLAGLHRVGGLSSFRFRHLTVADWRELVRSVRGFWFDGWIESSFDRILIVLVRRFAGEAMTGYFFQARRLAIIPHQIASPISFRMMFNYLSNRASSGRQRQVLAQAVGIELVVFLGAGITTAALAAPIVPWLFGDSWQPIVPLLYAMIGFLIGFPIFATLKTYFMATGQMPRFILVGRSAQFSAMSLAVLLASWSFWEPVRTLAVGLSAAYVLGAMLLVVAAFREDIRGAWTR